MTLYKKKKVEESAGTPLSSLGIFLDFYDTKRARHVRKKKNFVAVDLYIYI